MESFNKNLVQELVRVGNIIFTVYFHGTQFIVFEMTAALEKIRDVPVKSSNSQVDIPSARPSGVGRGYVYGYYVRV